MRIVLASQSPRRRELLSRMGICFDILPAKGSEKTSETTPEKIVEELAFHKAEEIFDQIGQYTADEKDDDICVIGADTIVVYRNEILGKPDGRADACRMIRMLQGQVHEVYTGVSILMTGKEPRIFHECTKVHVLPMTEEEISEYVSTKEPYDKAGAYGIQGTFGLYISGIEGDYNNVVGLPAARLYHELKKMKVLR